MLPRKEEFLEATTLFASVVKWLVLSIFVGAVVGASTSLFLKLLSISVNFTLRFEHYYFFLPLSFLLSTFLVSKFSPEAEGHGTEKVIEAVHRRSGRIAPAVVPVKLAATILTIATGGSCGKEGPCAQIGAGLTSILASLFRFNDKDREKLVICGISAGFSAVFGTPVAGAIFGLEVLYVGKLLYDVLFPSFVSGIISYQVASMLGISYSYKSLVLQGFSGKLFFQAIGGGVFFGLVSFLFIEVMEVCRNIEKRINPYLRAVVGGMLVLLLAHLTSRIYLGLGVDAIDGVLSGEAPSRGAFFWKMLFTALTLSSGGSGGIVTPIFFIGVTAGHTFASLLHWDPVIFSAIGLVALLAGCANTPIAASIMAIELFGAGIAPYAAIASIVSFIITGHRSVYPSQILYMPKSPSVKVKEGEEIHRVFPEVRWRRRREGEE